MDSKVVESQDRDVCDSDLDENWNERKRLIYLEFELRSKIQECLVKGGSEFSDGAARSMARTPDPFQTPAPPSRNHHS